MQIRARMSMSADGYVTTPSGWPALTADPSFVSGQSHGIQEFLLVVLPLLFGGGMQLTPAVSADAGITFASSRELPGGSVEIVYSVAGSRDELPPRPASQPGEAV